MLQIIMKPEDFEKTFKKHITKWKMLDFASKHGMNIFPFVSIRPVRLSYVLGMIIRGENPYPFYDDIMSLSEPDFEKMMIDMGKNKIKSGYLTGKIEVPKNTITTYNYNLDRYVRQSKILGDKTISKLTVTSLSFVEYTAYDVSYRLPILLMTIVNPTGIKFLRNGTLSLESNMCITQTGNSFIVSNIHCTPIEVKNI